MPPTIEEEQSTAFWMGYYGKRMVLPKATNQDTFDYLSGVIHSLDENIKGALTIIDGRLKKLEALEARIAALEPEREEGACT